MNDNKDAFDLWWEWAEKPLDSLLMIDAEIHEHHARAAPIVQPQDQGR